MPTVLVADDDAGTQSMISSVLTLSGHSVLQVGNGSECMARMALQNVDLAIIDIFMPEMDGLETLLELRERYPDTKVICMSGGGSGGNMEYLQMAKTIGADFILAKPFTARAVVDLVKRVLDQV